MKYLFLTLLASLAFSSFSQRFFNINFDQLPQDFQLYPRDDKNQSIIPISGTIEIGGWSYMSVVVYRNKKPYSYARNNFTYDNTGKLGTFSLKPIIKAELAEYDFKIYASQAGKDSVLTFERKNVVSGDAYLIYGQSNARAWEEVYEYRNEYCRTFGYGSFQNGYTWGLSNEGYTGGFDGEQFIVGEWGIHLQKNILENYGIPTCVINASTSGANIKVLSDRNSTNPADINTPYGRLIYMAQKSGVASNIKGLFYWQGETDAVQVPSLWKPGFEKMYGFWEKDLPSVKKIYTFQIPLFGAGEYNDEVGVLREYQRQLGKFFPKITPFAPIGVTGWNGWHFDLAGYKQIANELSVIVGKDFYGEKKTLISPNVQKVYFSNANKDEIALAFESGQQMVYPKDTLVPNIGGGFGTYSLKDFFYINKVWQRVASGRAEGNKIILKLKEPAKTEDTLIKYLPSIYPYSGGSFILKEAPWIYIGPFLKNSDGMRAFAFHHLKISPYLDFEKINLSSSNLSNSKVSLTWNKISNVKGYILERIAGKDSTNIQLVKQFNNSETAFTDSTLAFGTDYIYRIKSFTDLQESSFSTLKIKTSNDPNILSVNAQINYFNSVTINWQATNPNTKPEFYVIERKLSPNATFEQIAKISGGLNTYKDTTLKANTNYYYRIKAIGNNVTSEGLTDLKTPALLTQPELSIESLTFGSLKVVWKPVATANKYVLERQSSTDANFNKVFETTNLTEYKDVSLKNNETYSYRLKAFSDISESIFAKVDVKTLTVLANLNEDVEAFKVYPNPSKDYINIVFLKPTSGELNFTDLLGKRIFTQGFDKQNSLKINVSGFQKGLYFMILNSNQQVFTRKIMVE